MKEVNICSWIIIDNNKRILLIKRWLLVKNNKNYWAVPSWKCEKWEDLEIAAVREVKEEVGLDFHVRKLYFKETVWNNENEDIIKTFHRYLWKVDGKISLQEEECDGYGWFSYEETTDLLMTSSMKNLLKKLHNDDYIS